MKTSSKSSHKHMWEALENELVEFSSDNHNDNLPEIRLLCAVIALAAKEHDDMYLNSEVFLTHCYHLKLHYKFVMSLFKRAWRIEKSGVVWEYTQPLIENDDD